MMMQSAWNRRLRPVIGGARRGAAVTALVALVIAVPGGLAAAAPAPHAREHQWQTAPTTRAAQQAAAPVTKAPQIHSVGSIAPAHLVPLALQGAAAQVPVVAVGAKAAMDGQPSGSLAAVGRVRVGLSAPTASSQVKTSAAAAPVAVRLIDTAAANTLGISGILLQLAPSAASRNLDAAQMAVDYSTLSASWPADQLNRLQAFQLAGCPDLTATAATSPAAKVGCGQKTPLRVRNDVARHILTLTLPTGASAANATASATSTTTSASSTSRGAAPMTVALASGASGTAGDLSATSLSRSSSWQGGDSSGGFSWTYPVPVPPTQSGPAPQLALSYSSQAVDGHTASTNNQPSWIGEGFSLSSNFVERRYQSCYDNTTVTANRTGDLCWAGDNLTLSLNGKSSELIYDSTNSRWRLKDDDGTRIEHLTGTTNGDQSTSGSDGAGEYWKVTDLEGTQYIFGVNRLPGWVSGNPETNSVLTVPVFGNDSGEPCYVGTTFSANYCQQAWRWNLDRVVDVDGNSSSYFYIKQSGVYGRNGVSSRVSSYDFGSYPREIDYGMRSGAEYSTTTPPSQRVQFAVQDRCVTQGSTCVRPSTPYTMSDNWPDVPWDQYCAPGSTSCTVGAPTFYVTRMLSSITTQVLTGISNGTASYKTVGVWVLGHKFPDPNSGTDLKTNAALWLERITHTGSNGTTAVTDPDTFFTGSPMANRVNRTNDGLPPMNSFRINAIRSDTGDQLSVQYTEQGAGIGVDTGQSQNCTGAMVDSINAAANTYRCYPAWYGPYSSTKADWFHKYLVLSVIDNPTPDTGNVSSLVTSYQYLGNPAWAFDTDDLTPSARRLYNSYRGYATVRTVLGDTAQNPDDTRQATDRSYFRGLGGNVRDSFGGTHADGLEKQGRTLEEITYDGLTGTGAGAVGTKLTSTVTDYWSSAVNATRGSYSSQFVRPSTVTVNTWMPDTATWRTARTTTAYNSDGLPTTVDDEGDLSNATDGQCTRTTYTSPNTSAWLIGSAARVETVAARCAATPTMPRDAISDMRYTYDNLTYGAAPSKGHPTTTESLKDYTSSSSSSAVYQTDAVTTYDTLGRVTQVKDVLGRISKTAFTPTASGPLTSTVTTDPLGFTTTTTLDTGTGKPLTTTDTNGNVTTMTYDGMGRLTAAWTPGWTQANHPSFPAAKFSYVIGTAPADLKLASGFNYTASSQLRQAGSSYNTKYALLDGMLRPRQTQSVSASVNGANERVITDTFYNSRGQAYLTYDGYKANGIPSGTLFTTTPNQVDAQTTTVYDGAGRATAVLATPLGAERTRTTTVYRGNHTDVIPAGGASATRTYTDARGHTTAALTFPSDDTSVAETTADKTAYTYTKAGLLATVTDAGGSVWRYGYDERGRQISSSDPDKGATTTAYDDAGRVITTTDAQSRKTFTNYDNDNRVTDVRQDSKTGPLLQSFTYDSVTGAKNQLASASTWYSQDGVAYEYKNAVTAYNALYQPTSETTTLPSIEGPLAGSYTTSHVYALTNGAHTGDTFPAVGGWGAETISYTYNATGQPVAASSDRAGTLVSSATYDPYGNRLTLRGDRGGSVLDQVNSYTSDTHQPVTSVTKDFNATILADQSYGYSSTGDLIRQSDNATGDTQCFRYDTQRRLANAWTPTAAPQGTAADDSLCTPDPIKGKLGGPAPYWQSWTYWANGSRRTQNTHGVGSAPNTIDTYTYPAATAAQPHGVSSISSSQAAPTVNGTYGYDPSGNLSSRPGHTYSWDRSGHLDSDTTIDVGTGATVGVTSYRYDTAGQRIMRHDKDGITFTLRSAAQGATEVRYQASQYAMTRYYAFGDQTIAVRSSALGTPTSSTLVWCINDQQGSTIATVNAADTTQISRRFQTPFGDERTSSGVAETGATALKGAIAGNHSYVGGVADSEGTIHLGAREYLPQTGQFISVDPVIDPLQPAQLHPYSYSHNDPINGSDPSGLMREGGMDGRQSSSTTSSTPTKAYDDWWNDDTEITTNEASVSGNTATVTTTVTTLSQNGSIHRTVRVAHFHLKPPPPPQEHHSFWDNVKDVAGKAWNVIADVTGINDVISCVTNPSVGSCVMAAIDIATTVIPVAKGAVLAAKAIRTGVEVAKAAEEVGVVGKTIKAADEACSVGNSFAAGTRVLLADGESKPIDTIQVGDLVLASDPATGVTTAEPVTATILGMGNKNMLDLTIRDGKGQPPVIATTDNHPFWDATTHTWVEARDLVAGHALQPTELSSDTGDANTAALASPTVLTTRPYVHFAPVYNLTVERLHTYYVIATATNGASAGPRTAVLVHNCGVDMSKTLYRFGEGPETSEGLAADAARAVKNDFPHGVSTMSKLPSRIAESGEYRSAKVQDLHDAGFHVQKTGSNPYHHTVELPDQVTDETAQLFNEVFSGAGH